MTWTNIPDANLEPDRPIRSVDIIALRDNTAHVRDGNNRLVVFTSSGVYNKPEGIRRIKVTVIGGGAGGSTAPAISGDNAGAGGGAGGSAIRVIDEASIPSSVTVTIGAAGAANTNGGTSSFGALCSATGGISNGSGSVVGGGGGTGSGGDLNLRGAPGGNTSFQDSALTPHVTSGVGGGSILQGGGQSVSAALGSASSPPGNAGAANSGGGGSGGARGSGAGPAPGGAGSLGIVLVEEFY